MEFENILSKVYGDEIDLICYGLCIFTWEMSENKQ